MAIGQWKLVKVCQKQADFNYKESRWDCWNPYNCRSTSLVTLPTQCSSDDITRLASSYITSLDSSLHTLVTLWLTPGNCRAEKHCYYIMFVKGLHKFSFPCFSPNTTLMMELLQRSYLKGRLVDLMLSFHHFVKHNVILVYYSVAFTYLLVHSNDCWKLRHLRPIPNSQYFYYTCSWFDCTFCGCEDMGPESFLQACKCNIKSEVH